VLTQRPQSWMLLAACLTDIAALSYTVRLGKYVGMEIVMQL